MKARFLLALPFLGMHAAVAQEPAPAGGGRYSPPVAACLTPVQQTRIAGQLSATISMLTLQGKLPAVSKRGAAASTLGWPLRQATGFSYNSIYGVSNYVDRSPAYPNQLQDWNCGTRTYDLASGYNHAGMDIFLWPFDMNMMAAGQAEVVAAMPGVIIGKADGNFDRNCDFTNPDWNAVYVRAADGTVAWYGHLKTGTLTTKAVGATVAQGEYLGKVGSSGSSTGPHLHFELHDAAGAILDPYAGPCNPAPPVTWTNPKPYYESTINTLMTHSEPPVFATCPTPHTTNSATSLMPGARVYYAAYFHDQRAGQVTTYTIYRPDNSVYNTWNHSMTPAHYNASYWYWSYVLPATAPLGTWRFTATYQGTTVSHSFGVGTATATAASRHAAFALYPNPAHRQVRVELATAPVGGEAIVRNAQGQTVARQPLHSRQLLLDLPAVPGIYLVTLPTAQGPVTRKLAVE